MANSRVARAILSSAATLGRTRPVEIMKAKTRFLVFFIDFFFLEGV